MKAPVRLTLLTSALVLLPSAGSAAFTVPSGTLASGGATASGPAHRLRGTTGQAVVGLASNPTTRHGIGFWYVVRRITLISVGPTGPPIPGAYALGQNAPNPFNPRTTIAFALPEAGRTVLSVFDLTGREVARLVDEEMKPGLYTVVFQADDLSSGIYFYRLRSAGFTETRKMMLLK